MIYNLERCEGGLVAAEIVQALKRRETVLLDNDLLLAGVWVDPRYRVLLSDGQKIRAKRAVVDAYRRQEAVSETEESPPISPARNRPSTSSASAQRGKTRSSFTSSNYKQRLPRQSRRGTTYILDIFIIYNMHNKICAGLGLGLGHLS